MTTTLPRALITLLVAFAMASAGCLGALTKDDDSPETAGSDDKGTNGGNGSSTGGQAGNGDPALVNDKPSAVIRITNDQDPTNETRRGFKGDVLKLSAQNSSDEDGFITNWTWTVIEPLGEAGAPNLTYYYGEVVSGVVFGTEGVKIITLTVKDNLNATANASTTYYRDVSYSYGGEVRWGGLPPENEPVTGPVEETREHKFPVIAGAAALAASVQIDGAKAEITLIDPDGTEHVTGVTETNNVTIVMDHGAPAPGEWTIRVKITYEPAGTCLPEVGCEPGPAFEVSHGAQYGLQGTAWYGEKPAETKPAGDGHGDHDH